MPRGQEASVSPFRLPRHGVAAAAPHLRRRQFLGIAGAAAAGMALPARAASAAETVVVAVMGVNSRGSQLIDDIVRVPGMEISTLVEVDEGIAARVAKKLVDLGRRAPTIVRDVRHAVSDPAIDAIVIAAPNHWHAPATILAAAHGKHVYCEKPTSHTPREGELMIEAQRKHGVIVQIGTQRRSDAVVREAIDIVRSGRIGRVLHARCWYTNRRGPIGRGKPAPVPKGLDWELWQGPAPDREYRDNVVPYNWHWRWHWGGGELANNGPHHLDVCRWGLGVTHPVKVTALGGRLRYNDDQETPDTLDVAYDFGGRTILWEGLSWSSRSRDRIPYGAEFLGKTGTLVLDGRGGYAIFDDRNQPLPPADAAARPEPIAAAHMANFAACIRDGSTPNADVAEGHASTLLCHLGNIAYRTGRVLECDPATGRPRNVPEADPLWSREYRPGWEPVV
jgi:predicted dehydrogenase